MLLLLCRAQPDGWRANKLLDDDGPLVDLPWQHGLGLWRRWHDAVASGRQCHGLRELPLVCLLLFVGAPSFFLAVAEDTSERRLVGGLNLLVLVADDRRRWRRASWLHLAHAMAALLLVLHREPHLPVRGVGRMDKIVNIHYVDKVAFMNVDIVDKYEEVLTFLDSPTYEEVVAETQIRLKWVDPSDQIELLGRYDVGSAHKCRMKTMPIKSNLHWVAYKEAVASSIDKSLEVFASTMVNAPLHVDLNQPLVDDLSPYSGVAPIVEHKVEVQVNEYPQYEFGGSAPIKDDGHDYDEEYERQHNIVGDVEAQVRHDDMDPHIVYQRACVDGSDDEGPVNELDEDGFTEKEAERYTKITGRDHKVPLFCDVRLADKALVDGGMSKTIEARMFSSSTPNAISTSYLDVRGHSRIEDVVV
ncbi:hypothetical protein D1007_19073 [Hordeum vulgare]|nr:hypothetical protein D1007_19073 [Hordeum vulgare]